MWRAAALCFLSAVYIDASANCFGSENFYTCTDESGNRYSVSKFGNTTNVRGYNPDTGSTWNQRSSTFGNTTRTYGTDADGNSWNSTIQNYGSGNRSIYGTDSDGNSFNVHCNQFGCY